MSDEGPRVRAAANALAPPLREVVEIGGSSFLLRDLAPPDKPALLRLHREVFGSAVGDPWYAWKYEDGGAQGVGLWLAERLVAHAAGLPRWVRYGGRWHRDLQIGDVMVAPDWRGVLTRRGPFFHVCRALYESRLGADAPFSVGFGFPNLRHLTLAVRTGLAWDGGRMHRLVWNAAVGDEPGTGPQAGAAPGGGPASLRPEAGRVPAAAAVAPVLAAEASDHDATLHRAWRAMLADPALSSLGLGRRDAEHLRWRYRRRPDKATQWLVLRRPGPWPRRWAVRGVAVVTPEDQGKTLHWLDWVGPVSAMASALAMCRAYARASGAGHVSAWGSDAVRAALEPTAPAEVSVAAGIGVPAASALTNNGTPLPWWLMGGDTDFL